MFAALPSISADELVTARAVGLTGAYVQAMRAAGVRGDIDDLVQMYTVGIEPSFVARARRAGINVSDVDELVQLRALGGPSPSPPKAPKAPRAPTPPGGWDPDPDDG
jgi:hypothetical protein